MLGIRSCGRLSLLTPAVVAVQRRLRRCRLFPFSSGADTEAAREGVETPPRRGPPPRQGSRQWDTLQASGLRRELSRRPDLSDLSFDLASHLQRTTGLDHNATKAQIQTQTQTQIQHP